MANGAGLASRPVRRALRGSVQPLSRLALDERCSLACPTVPEIILASCARHDVILP